MQFSENWLRTFVNPTHNTEELSHALTMAGLEVEDLQPVGALFSKVVIGKILSADKHPDAAMTLTFIEKSRRDGMNPDDLDTVILL